MTVALVGWSAVAHDRLASTGKHAPGSTGLVGGAGRGVLPFGLVLPRKLQAEEESRQRGLVLITKGDGAPATQWGLGGRCL